MRGRSVSHRGLSPTMLLVIVLLVIVVGGGGTFGTLLATGIVDWSSLPWFPKAAAKNPHEGLIPMIVAGRQIPRYAKVTSEHLTDPATNEYSVTHVDPKMVRPDWLRDYGQILGRVLKRDKSPGKVFTEDDFYPEGTTPGRVAGIPPGKMGLTIDPAQIKGLAQLNVGDRFDVLASIPTALPPPAGKLRPGLNNRTSRVPQPATSTTHKVEVIVHHGQMVQMATPADPTSAPKEPAKKGSSPATNGDAMIALEPGESLALTRALAAEASLYCVARSGQPGDQATEQRIPSEPAPPQTIVSVETVKNRVFGEETFAVEPQDGIARQR